MIDLHAMRTTLARLGTKPQVAREIMRHSDYKTTLTHYTMLGLSDTAGAIKELPDIGEPETIIATGTMDASVDPQQIPQQSEHESVQFDATASDQDTMVNERAEESNHLESAKLSDEMQRDATSNEKAGDGIRTHDVQLGKLAAHSASADKSSTYESGNANYSADDSNQAQIGPEAAAIAQILAKLSDSERRAITNHIKTLTSMSKKRRAAILTLTNESE